MSDAEALARKFLAAAPNRTAAQWDAVVTAWEHSWQDNDHTDDAEFHAGFAAVVMARDIAHAK